MGVQEQYKLIGQLKAIKRRLDLICEKMGIEVLPLIKIDKDKKQKKQPDKKQKKQSDESIFVQGTGNLENYE